VRDDKGSRCRDREFEDKIVVRVWQERSPSEEYLLVIGHLAKTINDPAEFRSRESRYEAGPQYDRLILQNKGDGNGNTYVPAPDGPENLKAGTPIGSESRHKDRSIENGIHLRYCPRYHHGRKKFLEKAEVRQPAYRDRSSDSG
jgi:hypothetical protein